MCVKSKNELLTDEERIKVKEEEEEREGGMERKRGKRDWKNELYIIHFLVKDSLGEIFLESSVKYQCKEAALKYKISNVF